MLLNHSVKEETTASKIKANLPVHRPRQHLLIRAWKAAETPDLTASITGTLGREFSISKDVHVANSQHMPEASGCVLELEPETQEGARWYWRDVSVQARLYTCAVQ